jgi:hypothetical protein
MNTYKQRKRLQMEAFFFSIISLHVSSVLATYFIQRMGDLPQ